MQTSHMDSTGHWTVLKEICCDHLAQSPSIQSQKNYPIQKPIFCDGTFGRGGHSLEILNRIPNSIVLAIDRDPEAIQFGDELRKKYELQDRLLLFEGSFGNFKDSVETFKEALHWPKEAPFAIDGILLDLGLSSPQVNVPERGFSFAKEGPLDMRMDKGSDSIQTAEDLVNRMPEKELANLIFRYGEERLSRKIAREICNRRKIKPFKTTTDLAELIERLYPKQKHRRGHSIHPATRTFQALRIAVNDELSHLEQILRDGRIYLKVGGRFGVISFHSLEDRIVKRFFRDYSKQGPDEEATLKVLTKKPIVAAENEVLQNPRARSAKFRCAEKIKSLDST